MMKKINYIRQKQNQSNNFIVDGIEVLIKNSPDPGISVKLAVQRMIKSLPSHLLTNIKHIYVGTFAELERRKIQAMFKDSSIYITNKQASESDFLDDLIHEVAHSVEETHQNIIYGDKKIENEFLAKRKKLWFLLKEKGFSVKLDDFMKAEFDEKLDLLFYKEIGYPILSSITINLFYSPYACTSLREYFANGFEAFFMKEQVSRLKSVSPELFNKIVNLQKGEKNV